jgi:hypothetical protein
MASSSMLCNYARRSIGLRRLPLPSLHIQQMAIQQRDYANEVDGAGQSTGIEHALKFKQSGQANKCDFEKDYKCIEYLHFNKYSYYDIEVFFSLNINLLKKYRFIICSVKCRNYAVLNP